MLILETKETRGPTEEVLEMRYQQVHNFFHYKVTELYFRNVRKKEEKGILTPHQHINSVFMHFLRAM